MVNPVIQEVTMSKYAYGNTAQFAFSFA